MTELQILLERAADGGPDHADIDVASDLRRGHRAVGRRRRRAVAGSAAVLLGVAGATVAYPRSPLAHVSAAGQDDGVRAGDFRVASIPDGWAVEATGRGRLVIAPAGLPKVSFDDPHLQLDLRDKLLVTLRAAGGSADSTSSLEYHGRTFYVVESGPYPAHGYPAGSPPRQMMVEDGSGDWLWLQEAPRLHWTLQQMAAFLDGVTVTPEAGLDSS